MSRKKILLIVLLIPVVLVVGAWIFLDQIAKKAVEVGGEQAMGVPTALDGISLKPVAGKGTIEGLQVSNPQGFDSPFFMRLDKGDAALDVGSVFKDTIVMNSIELDGLEVHLEKAHGSSNYGTILENMKKGEEKAPSEEGGKKFLVQQVVVRNIRVHADVAVAGQTIKTVHLNIEEIKLENVGSDTGSGVVMSQLMGTIVKAVLSGIVQAGGEVLGDVAKDLGAGLAGLGKVGVKVLGKVTGQVGGEAVKVLGGAGKAVGGAAKDAIKGIGGLFGGDDDEKKKDDR
ncbi:MAG TPA: hypothetical protein VFY93_11015 [Planctomycetota bacterium]|nr:hypothetical protein [Planctomycetota bacterium]